MYSYMRPPCHKTHFEKFCEIGPGERTVNLFKMTESCPLKTNIAEISPHLICALCGGYLIDATTIVECLHSFCKTCIVRYLESSKYCPICEVLVHKTRPLQNIRLDHTLQDIVYKLVPNLFKSEMKRRREFYKDHPTIKSAKVRQEQQRHRFIYSADEQFSISLEFCPDGCIRKPTTRRSRKRSKQTVPERRYFLCPAGTTVGLLKKFVRLKFALADKYQVDIFHEKGPLKNHYSLMDVAYIYSWKREGVLQLYYSVFNLPDPVPAITITEIKTEKGQDIMDDTGQRLEDTRPSTLFNKATLLGNHSVARNIPHDLSPLELIATVANDICIQEGRGLKRKPDDAQLYENDEENNSSETHQLQKSIERAIDLCSHSNQGSPARVVVSNTVASSSNVVTTSSSVSVANVAHNVSVVSVPNVQNEQRLTEIKTISDISNVLPTNTERKVITVKEKPKKTDTASQCDPRPKKVKSDGKSGSHSKSSTQKVDNGSKETKTTGTVGKIDKVHSSESSSHSKSEPSKTNGVSIGEKPSVSMDVTQSKTSETSVNTKVTKEIVPENKVSKETTKDGVTGTVKSSSDSNRESNSVSKYYHPLPPTISVSKSNMASVRPSGSSGKSLSSSSSGSLSSNNGIKTGLSTTNSKTSIMQTKPLSSSSQSIQMPSADRTSSSQVSNKVSGNCSKFPSTQHSKSAAISQSTTSDCVKSSTLVNGHSNPSEVSKQLTKSSSSSKLKPGENNE
ncbi:Polycomb complex protein BMI-1 [Mactra antiquata]